LAIGPYIAIRFLRRQTKISVGQRVGEKRSRILLIIWHVKRMVDMFEIEVLAIKANEEMN